MRIRILHVKKTLEARSKNKKDPGRKPYSGSKQKAETKEPVPETDTQFAKPTVAWADLPDTVFSSMSVVLSKRTHEFEDQCSLIVDSGATGTVVGLCNYISICENLGFKPILLPREEGDSVAHAFGRRRTALHPRNHGRCVLPLPVGRGEWLHISAMVVDGDVPFMLGKDSLQQHQALESHGKEWLQMTTGERVVRFNTPVSKHDGHARILLNGKTVMYNVAESLILSLRNAIQNDVDGQNLVQRIHEKTHLHPKSMELLLKRCGAWRPAMYLSIRDIVEKCNVCLRCGDPETSKKFSISRLHMEFNQRVYFDIMYWQSTAMLHLVDYATGYSEITSIESRAIPLILQKMQNMWLHRHGSPAQMIGDMEFNKAAVRKWANQNCIRFAPLPARRHNKAGPVERKNRVIKDILEKLSVDAKYKTGR